MKRQWGSRRDTTSKEFNRFTTYQDARRVRLVDGLETNILRVSPVKQGGEAGLHKTELIDDVNSAHLARSIIGCAAQHC